MIASATALKGGSYMASLMELLEREVPELPVVQTDSAEGSSVIEPDSLEAELAYTAQRAKEVFGYDVLHNKVKGEREERENELRATTKRRTEEQEQMKLRAKVREIFTMLDIHPYSPTSVESYKQAMLDRVEQAYFVKDLGKVPNVIKGIWIALSIIVFHLCWMKFTGWSWFWSFNEWVAILPFTLYLTRFIKRWPLRRETENWPGYQWKQEGLRFYSDNVDPSALNIALQFHEYLPEAEFYVDALCKKPVPKFEVRSVAWSIFDDDPFLVMSIAGENHYLAVWGEPEFERMQHP